MTREERFLADGCQKNRWSRRQESNLYLALRRRSFYPLNYGEGQDCQDRQAAGAVILETGGSISKSARPRPGAAGVVGVGRHQGAGVSARIQRPGAGGKWRRVPALPVTRVRRRIPA
ncbi:hypothetical protein CBM2609_A120211 [Cupriavidus taiwanensis]|nr:hypothetical protein CBM2604_A100208 [Cupriavidus taiwanensis]SOZ23919.1 hypothetical protein CBM2609_A120211 [Cupriavidus taiwanensis]SOZ44294.1 hypothetical protein CBM2610_A120212 [Cupriavidus taiwanensis]